MAMSAPFLSDDLRFAQCSSCLFAFPLAMLVQGQVLYRSVEKCADFPVLHSFVVLLYGVNIARCLQ